MLLGEPIPRASLLTGPSAQFDKRAPSAAGNEGYRKWWATYQRLAASPGAAVAVMTMNKEIDVRPILSAIRCAQAIASAVKLLGFDIRAGLHTGECEVIGEKVGGIAVHIGARVAGLAGPGEVLVSSTVKDLVAGSGLRFEERGAHTLKGVPGEWRLFVVAAAS